MSPPLLGGSLPPSPVTGTLEQKAVAILQNNCFVCHGAVVPGSAVTSKIYDSISKNRMPPAGALSAADVSIIADWINQGAKAPAPGSVAPAPTPIPLAGTFASISANILMPKCVACHSATVAKGGVRLDSYLQVMKYVSKTQPAESKLYTIIKSGEMPTPPTPWLNSAELSAILAWIGAGALKN